MFKKIILLAALPLTFAANADVTLELPENVKLLVVNEQDANKGLSGFFTPADDSIILPNGENQIVFQVDEYFYKGGKQSDRVFSNPIIFTFDAENQILTLELPPFSNRNDIEQYSLSPTLSLKDKSNTSVNVRADALKLRGYAVTGDFADNTRLYNINGSPAAYQNTYVNPAIIKKASIEDAKLSTPREIAEEQASKFEESPENMMKLWFSKATPTEQKNFISWAVQNMKP